MKQKTTISINKDLLAEMKKDADKQGRNLSNYIEHIIKVDFDKRRKEIK